MKKGVIRMAKRKDAKTKLAEAVRELGVLKARELLEFAAMSSDPGYVTPPRVKPGRAKTIEKEKAAV